MSPAPDGRNAHKLSIRFAAVPREPSAKTLRDYGLSYDQSSRFQKLADVPEELFEKAFPTGALRLLSCFEKLPGFALGPKPDLAGAPFRLDVVRLLTRHAGTFHRPFDLNFSP